MSIMNTPFAMYYMRWTTLLILALVFTPFVSAHAQVTTQDISVIPVVIDEKAKVRDIIKQSITISNRSDHKMELYPSVNDINPDLGGQEFVSAQGSEDRQASLANWIELSRGVIELAPGEIKTIPFVIRVTANALPGTYHADVSFATGGTREEAEQKGKLASVAVNLEVQADVKEVMQLNKFTTDTIFFAGDDVLFNYQLENLGNQTLNPKGEIRIYNRKGEEVAAIDVNKDGKTITPDQVSQLASVWSAANGFGKYKAFLTVNYGSSQTASVQDTVFFWVIPWQQLLLMFVVALGALIFFGFRFEKWFHDRHMARMMPLHLQLARQNGIPLPAPIIETPVPSVPAVMVPPQVSFVSRALSTLTSFVPATRSRVNEVDEVMTPAVPSVQAQEQPRKETVVSQAPVAVPQTSISQGHTIDLKAGGVMRTENTYQKTANHVINLKS